MLPLHVVVDYHSLFNENYFLNVNSVRARIDNIKDYIKDTAPNILLLQEIKTQNENFPINAFKELGYRSHIFGQKSYNGVAIITNKEIDNINTEFIKMN